MKPESRWESDSKNKIKALLSNKGYSGIFDTVWKSDRNNIPFESFTIPILLPEG